MTKRINQPPSEHIYIATFQQQGVLNLAETFHDHNWGVIAGGKSYDYISRSNTVPTLSHVDSLPNGFATVAEGVSLDRSKPEEVEGHSVNGKYVIGAVYIDMMSSRMFESHHYTYDQMTKELVKHNAQILALAADCGRIALTKDYHVPLVIDWMDVRDKDDDGSELAEYLAPFALNFAADYLRFSAKIRARSLCSKEPRIDLDKHFQAGLKDLIDD